MRREWRSYLNERSGRCMRCSWEQIQDAARGEGKGTPAGEGSRGCLKFEGWSGVTIRRNQLTVSREVPRLLNSRLPPPPFLSSFPPPPFPFPPSFSLHPLPPCHTLNTSPPHPISPPPSHPLLSSSGLRVSLCARSLSSHVSFALPCGLASV